MPQIESYMNAHAELKTKQKRGRLENLLARGQERQADISSVTKVRSIAFSAIDFSKEIGGG